MAEKQKRGKRPDNAPSDQRKRLRGLKKGGSTKAARQHSRQTESKPNFIRRVLGGIRTPVFKPVAWRSSMGVKPSLEESTI